MTKAELLFRSLLKSMESGTVKGENNDNSRKLVVPIEFNSKGDSVVANVIFKVTANLEDFSQSYTEEVEVFPNKLRKEEDKKVVSLNDFLYHMRLDDEEYAEMEATRSALLKEISFGKREMNYLLKV